MIRREITVFGRVPLGRDVWMSVRQRIFHVFCLAVVSDQRKRHIRQVSIHRVYKCHRRSSI